MKCGAPVCCVTVTAQDGGLGRILKQHPRAAWEGRQSTNPVGPGSRRGPGGEVGGHLPPPLLWHLKGVTLAQPLSTPSLILAKYSASVHKPLRLAHGLSTLGCRGSASKSRSQDPPPWALGGGAQRDPLLGLEAASGVPSRGLGRGGPGCPPHAHTDPQPHGVRGLAASVCSQAEGSGSEPGEGASLRGRLWNKSSRQPAQEPGAHGQSRALGLCSAERSRAQAP